MTRTELVVIFTILLFLTFLLGWVCHWLVSRLYRVFSDNTPNLDSLGAELQKLEEERDHATTYLQQRETELINQLTQNEAELTAAMDALRLARLETDELRELLDKSKSH